MNKTIIFSVGLLLFNAACEHPQIQVIGDAGISQSTLQPTAEMDIDTIELVESAVEEPAHDFPVISIGNAENLTLQERIYPFSPEIIHMSPTGGRAAVGGLSGIKIIDMDTGELITHIDAPIQTCSYGYKKYFQFSNDGGFIAVALKDRIQVWQVGGGVIYEAPYKNHHALDPLSCGADIPQLAISSDGKLLVESGMHISANKVESYFTVTNIIENLIVYEWKGEEELSHGQLYTFPGLGFSKNESIFQTFDPTRFGVEDYEYNQAFRFWSTSNWEEIAPYFKDIRGEFSEGDLSFSRSEDGLVSIIDKIFGTRIVSLEVNGCELANPCQIKFSADGSKAAVVAKRQDEPYNLASADSTVSIFNVLNGEKLSEQSIFARDLDGILIDNNGNLISFRENALTIGNQWWTQIGYFSGFRLIEDTSIAFTPHVVFDNDRALPPYFGSCQIQLEDFSVRCFDSLVFEDGSLIDVERKNDGISIYDSKADNKKLIADIKDPQGEVDDVWQFRFNKYISTTGKGFICVDRNFREGTCFIIDFPENEILYDNMDLDGIQYSPETRTAAFVDKDEKILTLFYDEGNLLKKVNSFKAVAYPVKPVFLSEGIDLIYIVQSVDNQNLFLERVDAVKGKVIQRYDIDEIQTIDVSSIAVSSIAELWAFSDETGKVYIIDPIRQTTIHAYQAMDESIEDMVFSQDGKSLIMIGKSGIISIWAVGE